MSDPAALRALLQRHAHGENAYHMQRYMRDRFPFYGIKAPRRKELVRLWLKEQGKPEPQDIPRIVRALWDMPERENQYAALDLLYIMLKKLSPDLLPLTEELVVKKSWWDSIDPMCVRIMGGLLAKTDMPRVHGPDRWIASDNFWLQRCALLFQLKYKQRTDLNLIFAYIRKVAHMDEFFIRKAIGWILRENSKIDAASVVAFIEAEDLSPLSRREGLKWLVDQGRYP